MEGVLTINIRNTNIHFVGGQYTIDRVDSDRFFETL